MGWATAYIEKLRNITKPCIDCGTKMEPRMLVDIGLSEVRNDAITRPLCAQCWTKRGM